MLKDEENIKNDDVEGENKIEQVTMEEKEMLEETLEGIDVSEVLEEHNKVEDSPVDNEEIKVKQGGFLAKLGANIVDQGISLLISLALVYLFNLILIPFGYKVGDKVFVFLIIYVIVNILYGIITEASKLKKTIGKSILKI
jgi:hypothetical protein